ncbi:MAG: hypothetical protein VKI83_00175 [Synechococcaceae cyanobacterium]|nr:hypothetical protein [Synechococcaceae cyanobacterium]
MSLIHNLSTPPALPGPAAGGGSSGITGDSQPGPCDTDQKQRLASHLNALAELASELEGDPEELLNLLRQLEQLHRTIQDGAFRASLPEDRNALFRLLSEMESSGGWPYIPRLQLRTFLDLLQREEPRTELLAGFHDAPHDDSALAA